MSFLLFRGRLCYAVMWREYNKKSLLTGIEMDKYITAFDDLWKEWNDLSLENDNCPSMYRFLSNFFGFPVGIQETIDKYRNSFHFFFLYVIEI